ncbi:MAG: PIN domain protein [Euryarchaeota archaeon]|nr:PIN domain protein [Euryarchaeota archaeon]
MKLRVYVDTSVIGGIYDPEFKEWSGRLIEECMAGKITLVISDLTMRELDIAPEKVKKVVEGLPDKNLEFVVLSEEARQLAAYYIKEGAVSARHLVDAQHIAIATTKRVDVLGSWNFGHIVNLKRIRLYNAVNLKYGYPLIEIRSPREVVRHEETV